YEKCLVVSLREAGPVLEQQLSIPFFFRGQALADFSADLLIDRKVLVDIKTCTTIDRTHEAQLLNYLRATEIEIGLLLNFGERPQIRRLIFDNQRKKHRGLPEQSSGASTN